MLLHLILSAIIASVVHFLLCEQFVDPDYKKCTEDCKLCGARMLRIEGLDSCPWCCDEDIGGVDD